METKIIAITEIDSNLNYSEVPPYTHYFKVNKNVDGNKIVDKAIELYNDKDRNIEVLTNPQDCLYQAIEDLKIDCYEITGEIEEYDYEC